MNQFGSYSLPATAVCPGCGAIVTLPAEPIYPDSPPSICATCETEVPDYRRESFIPEGGIPATPAPGHLPHMLPHTTTVAPVPTENPLETTRVSRAGLFRSLGGILAERGAEAVDNARDRINDTIQNQ